MVSKQSYLDDINDFLHPANVMIGSRSSGGFRGGDGGDASPPTSLKVTILAEKSALILNKSAPFRDASPPHRPKRNESGPKNQSQFWWRPFFFFFYFGDHLILGEKNVWISDFGQKITLNFGEDIRIFEVLASNPPHQNFLDPPLSRSTNWNWTRQWSILI